jgi:hypothetical protein
MSVNVSRVWVFTRAPVAGGEMAMLEAAVPNEPLVITTKVGVEGILEPFPSGLPNWPIRKLFSDLTGPRKTPVLAGLRLLDSGPDPSRLPRPSRKERVGDADWTASDPIRLPPDQPIRHRIPH